VVLSTLHLLLELGFDTTSCELSYYMNLSLRFLLSPQTTTTPDQHTVHPYGHWWSHQRSNQNTFRGISVPDALPRRMPNWTILEEDFLGLSHPQPSFYPESEVESEQGSTEDRGYDTIVTLYFIDTASNIISYVSHPLNGLSN
jgi:N2227-like protein